MPRVLIAGCGYLGQAVADLARAANWQVEGWTQTIESATKLAGKDYPIHAVDISQPEQIATRSGEFDVVIHSASTRGGDAELYRRVYLQGMRNLLGRFGRSRIVFIGSTSAYAQKNGEWVNEQSPAEPTHETGKILRETEQLVLANDGIVLRLAGIYGPARSALLTRFLRGEGAVDPEHDRFVNQIHRDDAASAVCLFLNRGVRSEIFNVVDDQSILLSECYRWLAARLKRPPSSTKNPATARKRGESNKRVSNAKLRQFGWAPRYPTFVEGMEKSVLPTFAETNL